MRYQNHHLPTLKPEGFSFIEVMVVIIILGLLAGLVGVSLFDSAAQAKVDTTVVQIRGLGSALDLYRLHNSRYPQTEQGLAALVKKPEVGVIPKNWNGPYIKSKKVPKDAWGTDFKYTSDGREYQIISLGADTVEGGAEEDADISSDDL
ncbi:type II secretion system major pseudopilin GspG [Deltaproteobacteria bacterium TL4]